MKHLSKLLFICLLSSAVMAKPVKLDTIIASVNDTIITQSELSEAFSTAHNQGLTTDKQQVLNDLIDRKLQLELAEQIGISITTKEVNEAITRIAQQNHLTSEELFRRVAKEGLDKNTYLNEIKTQMTLQKVQQQEITSKISITEQEVKEFIHSEYAEPEYAVKDIFFPIPDDASPEQIAGIKKLAENQLHNFKTKVSLLTNALEDSNNLGWRKLSELPSQFSKAVLKMTKGNISSLIEAPNGFHVLYLDDKRLTQSQLALNDAKQALYERKYNDALHTWLAKLRSQAIINKKVV